MLKSMPGKRNTYSLLVGKQTGTMTIDISFLQKDENRSTTRPSSTILGHTPKIHFTTEIPDHPHSLLLYS